MILWNYTTFKEKRCKRVKILRSTPKDSDEKRKREKVDKLKNRQLKIYHPLLEPDLLNSYPIKEKSYPLAFHPPRSPIS
jgi:hypothetical protein